MSQDAKALETNYNDFVKIDISKIYKENEKIYNDICNSKNYDNALMYFKNKGLYKTCAKNINTDYCTIIENLLSSQNKEFIDVLKGIIPNL